MSDVCAGLLGFKHTSFPPTMMVCTFCGLNLEQLRAINTASCEASPFARAGTPGSAISPFVIPDSPKTPIKKAEDRFASFQKNRTEIEQTRREGFQSKKDKTHPKGKFEVGARKETKVSDNRVVDIYVGSDGASASSYKVQGASTFLCEFNVLTV
jgi:hypothetical protein